MRYIFFFLFLFCAVFVKAQEYDFAFVNHTQTSMSFYSMEKGKHKPQKAYKLTPYWKKYKVLRGCAWGALGVGICGMGAGVLGIAGAITGANSDVTRGEAILIKTAYIGGACLIVSSIPLFVFSYINRRKAKRSVELSLNTTHIYMPLPNGMQQAKLAPGLCLNF